MKCPACLTYHVDREATTTVRGTSYCDQHGVEALQTPEQRLSRQVFAYPVPDPS